MTYDTLLTLLTILTGIGWTSMIVAPRSRVTRMFLDSHAVQIVIGCIYIAVVVPLLPGILEAFRDFASFKQAFASRDVVFAGVIHYLAFDLLVGRYELTDAQQRGIPHLLVVPCLLLTLIFGPAGYLLYLVVRACWRFAKPAA